MNPPPSHRDTSAPAWRRASGRAGPIRIAFVHISGLCWSFFGYHLLIRTKQAGVQLIDRPVSTIGEQIAQIDGLLREDIDVLMFCPMASGDAKLLAVLERARAQGIHLISIDGLPGGTIDCCSVTADNFGGQAALASHAFAKMNGQGKIAYLQGDLSTEPGWLRNEGLQSALRRFPGIELLFTAAFDWSSSAFNDRQGMKMAEQALDAHPDLDAIISATDEGALGVSVVLGQRGLRDKIMVTGFDGMPEAITALAAGDLEVTARQPLDTMAHQALDLALGLIKGVVTTPRHCVQPVDLVSRENIADAAMRALRVLPEVTADLNARATQQKAGAAFLEALFDVMPTMVVVKDAGDLRCLRANKAHDAWHNVPGGWQVGKTADDLYPPAIAAGDMADDRAVLAGGCAQESTAEEPEHAGAGRRYTRSRKIPIFDAQGQPDYLMVISEDITEHKRSEQALSQRAEELEKTRQALKKSHEKLVQTEKMAALGALVAGVSHELNTPIGNALMAVTTYADYTRNIAEHKGVGLTRAMLEDYLDEAAKGLDLIARNLRRAAELINGFKEIAVDQASSQARTFSLATVVGEVLLAMSPTLRKTPFVVEQRIPADLLMDSFPGPLEQVLMNLINNAVIHGFEGRTRGRITIEARLAEPGRVELAVEDDGVGIAPERIKLIFDPFYSTKFGKGGSGLGLSISSNIVTRVLGGQIDASSIEQVGTRFCLTLPLRRRHD